MAGWPGLRTPRHPPPGTGHRAPGTGHRAPGTGHRAPGTGHRAPGTGHRAPGTGHRAPGTGHRAPGVGSSVVVDAVLVRVGMDRGAADAWVVGVHGAFEDALAAVGGGDV